MTQKPSTHWELAVVLPLGVAGHQLSRIEEQLRVTSMRALELGAAADQRTMRQAAAAKLERIRELLGSIGSLVADIDDDLQPAMLPAAIAAGDEDLRRAPRKPRPEQDD
jgi:hypothetical protein